MKESRAQLRCEASRARCKGNNKVHVLLRRLRRRLSECEHVAWRTKSTAFDSIGPVSVNGTGAFADIESGGVSR